MSFIWNSSFLSFSSSSSSLLWIVLKENQNESKCFELTFFFLLFEQQIEKSQSNSFFLNSKPKQSKMESIRAEKSGFALEAQKKVRISV